jgi:hypothetical protein
MPRKTAKADVIPVRQQNQYNCMTTSLAMALRALGVPEDECSPQQVNKVVGAMPLRGAAWEPLLAAANHYGMRATLTLPSTVRQLKEWTDAGIPVVIAWNPENREWSHASLVFDVDDDLNVYVADPNIPDPDETVRVVPKAEFYGKWYEKSPQGFLIRRPACAIQREITTDGRQVMASTKRTTSAKRVASAFARKAAGERLDRSLRQKINRAMERKGLDGNGRFRKPEEGYSRAVDVMQEHGIELDEVVSSHLFSPRPSGTVTADIALTNEADRFSPVSLSNSMLYLQYTEVSDDRFEVVAYLS